MDLHFQLFYREKSIKQEEKQIQYLLELNYVSVRFSSFRHFVKVIRNYIRGHEI
jgi:hypothetical protein